jgi:hypothetical protein
MTSENIYAIVQGPHLRFSQLPLALCSVYECIAEYTRHYVASSPILPRCSAYMVSCAKIVSTGQHLDGLHLSSANGPQPPESR